MKVFIKRPSETFLLSYQTAYTVHKNALSAMHMCLVVKMSLRRFGAWQIGLIRHSFDNSRLAVSPNFLSLAADGVEDRISNAHFVKYFYRDKSQ